MKEGVQAAQHSSRLTEDSLLARNVGWNLLGQGAPLFLAIYAMPRLIRDLGPERFGILTLAWVVIGYFSLFDVGMGRALTKLVAERLGTQKEGEISEIAWSALFLMALLGLFGTLVMILSAPWLAHDALKIPLDLQPETVGVLYLLALSIPVVILTSGLAGLLEAHQEFKIISSLRFLTGIATYVAPLLVLPSKGGLFPVVIVLMAGRIIILLAHILCCLVVLPSMRVLTVSTRWKVLGPLLQFGSWMTASNILTPLMVYLDRFLIGAFVSVAAVAYYATPYEVVTKLWVIPSAIVAVLFPAFAATVGNNPRRAEALFIRGVKYSFLALFPITLIIVIFARDTLSLWLSPEFARNSTVVLQWLALGVFINSLARIPLVLVQGAGRPDLISKICLLQLPFYLPAGFWLVKNYGIEGAAIAWVARVAVDTSLLFWLAFRMFDNSLILARRMCIVMIAGLVILGAAFVPTTMMMKGLFLIPMLLAFTLVTWFVLLTENERGGVNQLVSRLRFSKA